MSVCEGRIIEAFSGRIRAILCVSAYLWFDAMLQNIWDARILTGGVSMQRVPMSTELMSLTHCNPVQPTPAKSSFTEHIVYLAPYWTLLWSY